MGKRMLLIPVFIAVELALFIPAFVLAPLWPTASKAIANWVLDNLPDRDWFFTKGGDAE